MIPLVQAIINEAALSEASDIHFEPYQSYYRIRIRMDGRLKEIARPSLALSAQITSGLKIMAALDIAEKRLPQEGRFVFTLNNQKNIDCRMNVCPTLFGEKVVLRLLDPNQQPLNIDLLGMDDDQKNLFLDHIQKPQGLLLVTGPTGSGKTVSLYTALALLNTHEINIATVEDPIEIYLPGINQVAVHPKIGLSFSHILKTLLRQDPDVLMIGEIRDKETAEIAIQAAQTGHLVLATLHTNNALESIHRLQHLGVSYSDIATSLKLVIAQRLVRKLCHHCQAKRDCKHCYEGYKGRTGVYEFLSITPHLADILLYEPRELARHAGKDPHISLYESALEKVKQGITDMKEVYRVIHGFSKQLALLLNAHVSLIEALHILVKSTKQKPLSQLIDKIKFSIEQGRSLSTTLSQYPSYFNALYCHLVACGEASGKLDVILNQMTLYQEKVDEFKQDIQKALTYPLLITLVFFSVVILFMLWVIPSFERLFDQSETPLPFLTQSVIDVSHIFARAWPYLISIILLSIFFLKTQWTWWSLKIPWIKTIVQHIILLRSLKSLALTLSAGVPLMEGLELSAHIAGHPRYEKAYKTIQSAISRGMSLSEAMRKTTLFPNAINELIHIGENTGTLEPILFKIAEIEEKTLNDSLNQTKKMLEPCLIIIMGLLIGLFMIALYLPLFSMGTLWI